MTYTGIDPEHDLYAFKLAGQHKGHDYYHGSSGAPIADMSSHKIVSLVIDGCEKRNEIYGARLSEYAHLIAVG